MIRLEPTNLALIDEPKKVSTVKRFNGIFNNERLTIWLVKELVLNKVVDEQIKFNTYNVYTDAEDFIPSDFLPKNPKILPVVREFSKYVVVGFNTIPEQSFKEKLFGLTPKDNLPEGLFYATSLCIYDLPDSMVAGLAFSPEYDFEIATLNVDRLDPNDNTLTKYEEIAEISSQVNKYSNKLQNISIIREGLQNKNTYLHKWDVVYTFTAKTLNDLEIRVKRFQKDISRLRVKVDRPAWVQKRLYEKRHTRFDQTLISDTNTLSAFYPFSSVELIEEGNNSVYLGENAITHSPVIYNRENRQLNYHIVICGASGVGKSMTTKVMIDRMTSTMKDNQVEPSIVIIDPSATKEYKNLAKSIGIEYKSLDEGIGIDPLNYDPALATGILTRLFKLDDKQSDQLLRVIENMKEKNIFSLENEIPKGESLLERVHHGMVKYGYIFKGTFPKSSFAVSTFSYDDDAIKAASTMIMLTTKKTFDSFPFSVPKFLIVDEGWKLIEDKNASEIIKTFSKEGRKSNISLVFITQDPKDILENDTGRTILNNCDTKILMQTDAAAELAEALSLSSIEEEMLKTTVEKTDLGTALIIASHKHIHCRIKVKEKEMKKFTTKA